jgi:hypothetical protein
MGVPLVWTSVSDWIGRVPQSAPKQIGAGPPSVLSRIRFGGLLVDLKLQSRATL